MVFFESLNFVGTEENVQNFVVFMKIELLSCRMHIINNMLINTLFPSH